MSTDTSSQSDEERSTEESTTETDSVEPGGSSDSETATDDVDALRARMAVLSEENRRLRREYARARQSQHRRASLGLAVIGLVAIAGALLFAHVRTTLLVLGATGLFGAVLTYFLTPERFVPASVSERVYRVFADNLARITVALGLQETYVYVPFDDDTDVPARLFIPQRQEYEIPRGEALDGPFAVLDDERSRGIVLIPMGGPLFEEFRTVVSGELGEVPAVVGEQVADAIVESFEMASAVTIEVSDSQLVAGVTGSLYGDADRFDHPIPSLLATALAVQLSRPVEVSSQPAEDERADVLFTFRWDSDAGE